MRRLNPIHFVFVLALVLTVGALTTTAHAADDDAPPALTLVSATPFTLDAPVVHRWHKERPHFDRGWILVLRSSDAAYLRPRQDVEPVIQVGATNAGRVDHGTANGYVTVIVPEFRRDDDTVAALDLTTQRAFFATPRFPEQVTRAIRDAELRRAIERGVPTFAATTVRVARERGGDAVRFASADALRERAKAEAERVSGLIGAGE